MESPFDQAQRFSEVWTEYTSRMAQLGMSFDPTRAPPEMAKQMRSIVFAAMAQYTEDFLRSPQFLDSVKQSMDSAIAFRKQLNEWLTAAQHGVQGVARQDVDSLMLTMRHIETRLLDSIENVTCQLDSISTRLEALEHASKEAPESPAPASAGD